MLSPQDMFLFMVMQMAIHLCHIYDKVRQQSKENLTTIKLQPSKARDSQSIKSENFKFINLRSKDRNVVKFLITALSKCSVQVLYGCNCFRSLHYENKYTAYYIALKKICRIPLVVGQFLYKPKNLEKLQ